MKKIASFIILIGCFSSVFAATWHYDTDGCTKVYNYGYDSSECFDQKTHIYQEAGHKVICKYGYCF
ncbi:hypothetical protein C3I09_09265 [Campylobacter jejuni]|uniref:hypothetical protein n=1 Tax=Campylobacter jejuni TaxID=197 RepID=UPI000F80BD0A|nr:hypothetical protein [Campylobacter jejuni]EAI3389600.1 hypothetical protein [Campylobacter jejuni]EAJ7432262.1 hypothetical protein [Campylobacter coli]RTI78669.1 hypothetical protein C3I09_09265 [Campylobacter jejuni]